MFNCNDAVLIAEADTVNQPKLKYLSVNQAFTHITAYSLEELLGKTRILKAAKTNQTVLAQIRMALEAWQPIQAEFINYSKDGSEFWVELNIAPVADETGCYTHWIAIERNLPECKWAEEQLRLFQSVVVKANDAVMIAEAEPIDNATPRIIYVNEAFTRMTGYSLEDMRGRTPRVLQGPKTDRTALDQIRMALEAWQPVRAELVNYRKDGSEFWVELNIASVADETGRYTHWISVQRDITERKQTEVALKQQTEQERLIGLMTQHIRQSLNLEEILDTTVTEVRQFLQTERVFIYRFEPDWSGIVTVESIASGWSPILGRKIKDSYFVEPSSRKLYKQGRIQALADIYTAGLSQCHIDLLTQLQVRANLVVPILQGEELWGLLVAQQCSEPRLWQQFEIDLLKQLATQVAIAIQQSELYQQLQAANQQLQRLASLDSLTQVANRRRFDEYLEQEWRRMAREQAPLSLILCDIDCFKTYNDTYGHLAGDDCLQQVARAIGHVMKRPPDLVARYGGEEFAVILPNTKTEGAIRIAEKIRSRIKALRITNASSPFHQHITLSLGVASTIPSNESSPTTLIAAADRALYQAKAQGRDRVVIEDCLQALSN